jgi:hypothetical protein
MIQHLRNQRYKKPEIRDRMKKSGHNFKTVSFKDPGNSF